MMPLPDDSLLTLIEQVKTRYPGYESLKMMVSQTDAEFDEALEGMLERTVIYAEQNANFLVDDSEDAITAFITAYLNGSPGIRVLQQAHTNGHVDITVESDLPPLRRRLGEAKIYGGPAYHVKGLEQLVNRYSTGREGAGFVVEYVKDANIKDLVAKIKSYLDNAKPCSQDGDAQDHRIRWAFITYHQHSSGELLRVLHLNCNLHRSAAKGSGVP